MAGHAREELDEFFDFTRLEADMNDELHTIWQPGELPSEATQDPERLAAMEWEPSICEAPVDFDALCLEPFPSSSDCDIFQPFPGNTPQPPAPPQWHEQPPVHNEGAVEIPPTDIASCTVGETEIALVDSIQPPPSSHVTESPLAKNTTHHTPQEQHRRLPLRAESDCRKPASAKHKGPSTRIPLEARQMLEDEFSTNPYPCSWEIDIIAHQASLDAKRVRNWFNNARARKKVKNSNIDNPNLDRAQESTHSLASKLSADSLEALSKQVDEGVSTPQPPLAVYLASSYLEEAAQLSDIQAAIGTSPSTERGDSSSCSRIHRSGSVVTSHTSSDGSAPTTYTLSSGGSNTSSFGRDRRRGRRRMTWRNSPYSRNRPKIDGLNDAGLPSRNLPFFCTFCPRAFKTKYEWNRHEDSVHALRTTWICCSNKAEAFETCPFCGESRPDEVHLAGHKYQQCRNKPEVHRTFYRRDHFIQHLHHVHFGNVKHPSTRFGCGTRAATGQSNDYGCKELAMKWRRFGAPIKSDDPMLHCGFCGKRQKDWNTRCDHVAEHLSAGGFDRSAWWPERKPNHMENLFLTHSAGPFRCRYCRKVFENTGAMNNHSHCRVWSCRFLPTFDDVASENSGPPLCPQFPSPKAHHCHLCGAGYRSGHVEHAQQYHNYRLCKQDIYTSKEDFLEHLHEFHKASNPLLLIHNAVLEQHFSRNKGASFEPVHFDEILQGCRVATPTASFVDPFTQEVEALPSLSPEEIADWAHTMAPTPGKKTSTQGVLEIPVKILQEPPVKETLPKEDPPGPRIFRLDPLVPFLSSRIYYLRNAKMSELFSDGKALLKEVKHGHVASLVMSSGLLGMAGVRMPVQMKKYEGGLAEFALEDEDD